MPAVAGGQPNIPPMPAMGSVGPPGRSMNGIGGMAGQPRYGAPNGVIPPPGSGTSSFANGLSSGQPPGMPFQPMGGGQPQPRQPPGAQGGPQRGGGQPGFQPSPNMDPNQQQQMMHMRQMMPPNGNQPVQASTPGSSGYPGSQHGMQRPPSRAGTPHHNMGTSSPSMAARGHPQNPQLNADLGRLPPAILEGLKADTGLMGKDIASMSIEEKVTLTLFLEIRMCTDVIPYG